MLRPYQQEAVDAALAWVRRCLDPAVIEAPTGSGKSHIIAGIAHGIQKMSGKKILVIAPSGELVDQDYAKYRALGEPASIYSASLGRKEMSADVVFGSPLTVSNSLRKFGHQFSAVIIDEAHGITPTLRRIVEHMRSQNPKLRVIGLSATPYRLGEGYIYGHHYQHGLVDECLENPFFP
jgi:DNA repair protein RadD